MPPSQTQGTRRPIPDWASSRPAHPGPGGWLQRRGPGRHERRRQQRLPGRCPDRVSLTGAVISPATGPIRSAFLVFGNRSVTVPVTQNWASSTPSRRVGTSSTAGQRQPDQSLHQPRPAVQLQLRWHDLLHQPVTELADLVPTWPPRDPTRSSSALPITRAAAGFTTSRPRWIQLADEQASGPRQPGRIIPSLNIVTYRGDHQSRTWAGHLRSLIIPNLFGDGSTIIAIGEPRRITP